MQKRFGNIHLPFALLCAVALMALLLYGGVANAALKDSETSMEHLRRLQMFNKPTSGDPLLEVAVHKVGNINLCVTNYGIFGNQNDPSIIDPETGQSAPSCVYPAGSGIEYLFQGALWVGAVVDEDTLVSTGHDGWQLVFEFYADAAPKGAIIKRSTRKSDPAYSPDAVSEADYIATYSDTLTDPAYVAQNPDDGRPHIPLHVQITQKSYSWSYSYAEDFILLDFLVRNIGQKDITNAYMAIYVDGDVGHPQTANYFQDDICGFKHSVPSPACDQVEDIINVAWIADNDGDPSGDVFTDISPTAVTGTRVVRTPNPDLKTSFNWWVSQGDAKLDWGPVRQENNRDLGTGGLGTPAGDANKYFFMKNNEFDYDQLYSNIDYSAEGWLPPNTEIGSDLADGYDTRYLLSFGPFDIIPGDSLPITMAYVAGDHFHVKPTDFKNLFDADNPAAFANSLDFSDLATNAQWAGWVYDNPGVDTDGNPLTPVSIDPNDPHTNPCTGGQYYTTGDGIPDFAGPPPPSPPILRFTASPGRVEIVWNGKATEEGVDPFSFQKDFEGYRVYMADHPKLSDYALLTSWDHTDFDRYRLNTGYDPPRWELTEVPFTLDSLRAIYGPNFAPLDYPTPADSLPWVDNDGTQTAYYFTKQDFNQSTLNQPGTIAKVYPDAQPGDMVWAPKLQDSVDAYYEYEYVIEGLLASQPKYFAVTAFDYGNPKTSLAPLESSPIANSIEVYPTYSSDQVTKQDLKVKVFPNPYRSDGGYVEAGYEKPQQEANGSPSYARRIWFSNLPAKATIRIYTLDGDLVRELQHPCGCKLQAGESMMAWDLITRNTQAAVSGIYLYTVESDLGTQVGKFVVIK